MRNKIIEIYSCVIAKLEWPQSVLLLLIRVVWGWGFFETGKGKWMHFERTVTYFMDLGIPFPQFNAMLAATTEMAGGLLLLLGLFTRGISLPLILTMCVAYLTAEHEALMSLFTEEHDKFFEAQPWPFLFACLILLLFGAGKISLDYWITKKITRPIPR